MQKEMSWSEFCSLGEDFRGRYLEFIANDGDLFTGCIERLSFVPHTAVIDLAWFGKVVSPGEVVITGAGSGIVLSLPMIEFKIFLWSTGSISFESAGNPLGPTFEILSREASARLKT
ncbi:MAG: hypothetical protein HZA81_01420 [Candidatus Taylorbacteria bacterium]|nr:hypothetical protein [Candidatus Taylorbacteria bacterium]